MAGLHLCVRNVALLSLVALSFLSCISDVDSFSVPQPLQTLRLRSGSSVRPRSPVMVLLPGDNKVDQDELKDSLKRFVDTAPRGIWHMVEKQVVPAAKAVILKELNKNKPPPAEEKTEELLVEEESVSEPEETEAIAKESQVLLEAPDSSDTMAKLQALLGRSVAEELEDFEYTGMENKNGARKDDTPAWMLDAKDVGK